jgi:molybdopterin synthase sulfur carrier subunit
LKSVAIKFYIPGPLRQCTNGRSEVEVAGGAATVAQALAALWQAHPGLRDRILTEQGAVRQHVNIFVGEENIRDRGGLDSAITSDSPITIVPAVSGG